MIEPRDLRSLVIKPTLEHLDLSSPAAVNLLLATAIAESTSGGMQYLKQRGGPALGIYQIEPATHRDVWDNFLNYRPNLADAVCALVSSKAVDEPYSGAWEVVWNLAYATAIARIVYLRDPQPLPPADNLRALGTYWKRVYNTPKGKGTVAHFLDQVEPHAAAFLNF